MSTPATNGCLCFSMAREISRHPLLRAAPQPLHSQPRPGWHGEHGGPKIAKLLVDREKHKLYFLRRHHSSTTHCISSAHLTVMRWSSGSSLTASPRQWTSCAWPTGIQCICSPSLRKPTAREQTAS